MSGANDECRMTNDELPDGWLRAPFSSVTVDPIQRVPGEQEKIIYIDIGSVDRDTKQVVEPQRMLGKDAPSRARKVIQTGDVLVSTVRPNLNAVALIGSEYNGQFASTGFDLLRSPIIDPRWLFYSVRTPEFLDRMSELVQGALYPAVRSKDIRSFVIPIAPLAEQKRIADKLEAVLGRVDSCRARLDRVPALLKRFRQSVLAAATSGKLTEEWRTANGVTDEWDLISLEDSIQGIEQGWSPKCESEPSLSPYEWAVIKTTAIQAMQFLEYENKRLPKQLKPRPDLEIMPGDILITRAGPRVRAAVTCMVPAIRPRLIACDKVYRFRAREKCTTPEYLNVYLNSPRVVQELDEMKTGISDSGVNLTQSKFLSIQIPFPTLPEQQEIARRIEDLFAFADRIEARLATAQKSVERLTPATLAKAFRGELVPQDPNDEPAIILLRRLQNSESTQPSKFRSRRKFKK